MFKIFRTLLLVLFLASTTTAVYSETSWIKKKSDKTKVEIKKEKKEKKVKKKKWIAKKKKNKKKFKEKAKNISEEVKSWITKKSKKNKYIKSFDELPKAKVYFVARSETGDVYFGYINPKTTSKKIFSSDGIIKIKKNNIGFAYLNDGKTICNVATEIQAVLNTGKIFGEVGAECTNKINFNGDFSQKGTTGNGTLSDHDGNEVFFNFYQNLEIASKNYDKFTKQRKQMARPSENPADILKPNGKYYALLIGNSNYSDKKFGDLASPKNDVIKLSKLLETKYKFEVITAIDIKRDEFFDKIDELKNLVTPDDYVLIYYSGHGEKRGKNEIYWIPVNASKNSKRDWVNVDDITVDFEGDVDSPPELPSYHLALLVDSCWFSVKGSSTVKNGNMSYQKLLNKRTAVVMASGQDEFVDEPGEGNSNFGHTIITELEIANKPIKLYDIFKQVEIELEDLDQTPIYRGRKKWNHGAGDFIFIPVS